MRLALMILLAACGGSKNQPTAAPIEAIAGDLVISDVTLVPMTSDATVPHQSVIVRGDKIVAIAPAAQVKLGTGAKRYDGAGKWLMPGLADMHVHTWTESDLTLFAVAGVTTIRNMWGSDQHLEWKKAIAEGQRFGPTLETTSPILDGDPPVWPGSVVVTKPEEVDALVAGFKDKGYTALKPYSRLSKPVYEALVAAAKKHGMTLQGHVPTSVGLDGAIAAGQKSIEHLDGWLLALAPGEERKDGESFGELFKRLLPKVDEKRIPAIAEQMKKAGVYNCPTLIVLARFGELEDIPALEKKLQWLSFISPEVQAMWNPKADFRLQKSTAEDFAAFRAVGAVRDKIVQVLATSGAPMIVGTDTGNPYVIPGEGMHEEIERLVKAGAARPRIMRAATADAGTFLGNAGTQGVIAVGARADLLLVGVDPMTTAIPLVPDAIVLRGQWLPKSELEAKLAALAKPASADRFAAMPPLAKEGTDVTEVTYEIRTGDKAIGEERMAVGTLDGKRVFVAQSVTEVPGHIETTYRIAGLTTRVEQKTSFGAITLEAAPAGGKLVGKGKDASGKALEFSETLPAGTFIAGPGIGSSIELAPKLEGMKVGETRTATSLELSTFPQPGIERAALDIKRKPDADGNRVFELTMKFGTMSVPSELVLDAKGIPVKQVFGPPLNFTFVRR